MSYEHNWEWIRTPQFDSAAEKRLNSDKVADAVMRDLAPVPLVSNTAACVNFNNGVLSDTADGWLEDSELDSNGTA